MSQLIPENLQNEKIPCRFIPLNAHGETLDSLYRTGARQEVESAVAEWLKAKIAWLELERANWARACDFPEVRVQAKFVNGV